MPRTETGRKRIPVIRHLSQAPPCPTGYAVSCSRVHSACAFASPDTSREVNSLSPRKIEICSFAAAGVPAPKPRVVCPPFIRVLREPPPDARQNLQRRLVTHAVRHRADHVFCKPELLSRTIFQRQVAVVLVSRAVKVHHFRRGNSLLGIVKRDATPARHPRKSNNGCTSPGPLVVGRWA